MNDKFKNKNILFCALDGTLIETISGERFPKGIWDMKLKLDVLDAIKKLKPEFVLIASNQSGIASGLLDGQKFTTKLLYIISVIGEYCGCECYAIYCDTDNKSDPYYKPNTKMLEALLEDHVGYDFDCFKHEMLMIGDESGIDGQFSDIDKKTAENFDIDYMDVNDFVNTLL